MTEAGKRAPGRPRLHPDERKVRVNVTLSPETIAVLDASPLGRSAEIDRLVAASVASADTL